MGSANRRETCSYSQRVSIRHTKHHVEESPLWAALGSLFGGTIALVISLPLLITFLLLLPIIVTLRWFMRVIYYKVHYNQADLGPEPMRGAEARWIGNNWPQSVIHGVLVLENREGLSLDHFQRILSTRILPIYTRLTRFPVTLPMSAGASHCWIPDNQFSISRHVLPGPPLASKQAIQEYLGKLLHKGLSLDKPPWEFHVISPYEEQKDTVIVVRVHQSIADGTTLLRVLCHSLADTPAVDIPERAQFGCLAFGLNVFRSCLTGPCTLLIWLWLSTDDCNPLTKRCNWKGTVTVTWSASITLPKVMRIKQVTRSTVNCVILSALAGALRVLLQSCGVRQPPNVKVLVPMDLRSQNTSKANSTCMGNKSASVLVPLPVSIEGCVPRLWATRRTLASLRSSADPVLLYMATAALMAVAPAAIVCYLLDLLADKTSLQFASLPGPTNHLSLGGERLKEMYSLLPTTGRVGISVTAVTYCDQVFVSVVAENSLGPAAQLLLANLEHQIEIMWKLLLNRRVPGEGRITCLDYSHNYFDSPIQDIEERLSVVQKEVTRLSEIHDVGQEGKLAQLKAEFAQLVGELKRRQSLEGREKEVRTNNTRRRAFSYSTATRHSTFSIKGVLPSQGSNVMLEAEPENIKENNAVTQSRPTFHMEKEKSIARNQTAVIASTTGSLPNIVLSKGNRGNQVNVGASEFPLKLQSRHRKNSFEIMRDRSKRNEFLKNGIMHNSSKTMTNNHDCMEKEKDTKSKDNKLNCTTNNSDTSINISDDDEADCQTTGPINSNLRDLYCANYLEYQLQRLRHQESVLAQQMNELYLDDQNDEEGGLLI